MTKLVLLIPATMLALSLFTSGFAATQYLQFVDQSGKPIRDVTVYYSFSAVPPYPGTGGTYVVRSDAEGKITIGHPCGISSGSCCLLVSAVSYTVSKLGYQFSPSSGAVGCGAGPSTNITVVGTGMELPRLSSVSSAHYQSPLTPGMISASFGSNLATTTEVAALPLKTTLGGRRVIIQDSTGREVAARLLFVSPTQINFVVPGESSEGLAIVILKDEANQALQADYLRIQRIAPGIFTANADGQGVPAAIITRVKPGNLQSFEPVAVYAQSSKRFVPLALDLGLENEIVVLSLFGTGWRRLNDAPGLVSVKIGDVNCPVEYAGIQPTLEGLDQINVRLSRTLIGRGDVNVEVKIENTIANLVQLKIK